MDGGFSRRVCLGVELFGIRRDADQLGHVARADATLCVLLPHAIPWVTQGGQALDGHRDSFHGDILSIQDLSVGHWPSSFILPYHCRPLLISNWIAGNSSTPTDRRINPSVMPCRVFSAGLT